MKRFHYREFGRLRQAPDTCFGQNGRACFTLVCRENRRMGVRYRVPQHSLPCEEQLAQAEQLVTRRAAWHWKDAQCEGS